MEDIKKKRYKRTAWTEERQQKLVALHKRGASIKYIAKQCDATERVVKAKVTVLEKKLCIGGSKKITEEEHEIMFFCSKKGWSGKMISRELESKGFCRTAAAVNKYLWACGEHRFHVWTDEENSFLLDTLRRLAKKLGVSRKTLACKIKNLALSLKD